MSNHQQWAKINSLLDAALDLPPEKRVGWLEKSCGDDVELRTKVEELLELCEDKDDPLRPGGAMTGSLWDELAEELQGDADSCGLEAGDRVGAYEILDRLGRGGMGDVYRAKHPSLDREVAVKALSQAFDDPSGLRRFEREAKLLASLNHPNIATVYDLLLVDKKPYLVLELVGGETLQERLKQGALDLDEVVAIAAQLVDAIDEAHRKGVVHRDLKPSNAKFSKEGRVKVLDFGLAKSQTSVHTEQRSASSITHAGVILGTPGYMSPEQARGEAVDKRTDIWAFGCLLYEMLTGKRAFEGKSVSDAIASVLRDDVDWSRLPDSTPPELRQLIQQCLKKNLGERLQDIGDARYALAELTSGVNWPSGARPRITGMSRWPWVAAAAALLLGVGTLTYVLNPRENSVPRFTNPVQITSSVGREDFPAWSPDGQTLAYAAIEEGNWDIWVTQIGAGPPLNRTPDHDGTDFAPSWSPDGRQIAFRSARDGGGIFVMSPLAGPPKKLVSLKQAVFSIAPPLWSSDGSELAFSVPVGKPEPAESLRVLSLQSGETRDIVLPGHLNCRCEISWSSDRQFLAYVDAQEPSAQVTQLWILRVSDGEATPLTDGRNRDWSPSWSADGRTLYFLSNRGGSMDLWQQAIGDGGTPAGPPQPVTVGVGMQRAVFSPDGAKLAYSKGRRVGNLYRVPILEDRLATWADAEQLTFNQALVEFVDVSPDGSQLVISSDQAGNPDLWILPLVGGEMQQLTDDPTPDWLPSFSPDGREVAFYAYRSGNRDIWVMPATGGAARQVTQNPSADVSPAWSPDGKTLLFYSNRKGTTDVYSIPSDGGSAQLLFDGPASNRFPRWSPNGKWIVLNTSPSGEPGLYRMPAGGGPLERLTDGVAYYPAWSRDSKRIFFTPSQRATDNLWQVSVEGGDVRPATDLTGRRGRIGRAALATDGSYLYFTWEEDSGDIWVMEWDDGGKPS